MNIIWQARKLLCPVERAIPISWNDGTDIAGTTDQFIRRVVETTYLMCRATDWFMLGQRVNSQRLLKEIESTVAVLQQMQTIFTQSGAAPQNSISADEFVTAFDISRWLSMRMTDIKYLADMYVQRKSSGTQELSCDDEKFISLKILCERTHLPKKAFDEHEELMTQMTFDYIFYALFFNHDFKDDAQLGEILGRVRKLNKYPLNPRRKSSSQYLTLAQFLIARIVDDETDLSPRRIYASEWYRRALATDRGLIEPLLSESARKISAMVNRSSRSTRV